MTRVQEVDSRSRSLQGWVKDFLIGYPVTERQIFTITGMHCPSCGAVVEDGVKALPGVSLVQLSAHNLLTVLFDPQVVSSKNIKEAIERLGYRCESAHHEESHDHTSHADDVWVLGPFVAVSAVSALILMANSMVPGVVPELLRPLWLQFVLSSIVQFWAGGPFYVRTWHALKVGRLTMDTLIVLGTSVAYGYSVAVWWFEPFFLARGLTTYRYFETSATIIALILVGNLLEAYARGVTSQAIRKLFGLQVKKATVFRDGVWHEIAADQIMVKDRLLIKPGERVPTDGVIVQGESYVDESMVTGESMPVLRTVGAMVIGATINTTGSFEMEATRVGKETTLARIIDLVHRAQQSRAPIQRIVDAMMNLFIPLVIGAAVVSFGVWLQWGPQPSLLYAIQASISVLIIACPCAMGIAVPMSIIAGIGRAAQEGILVKDAQTLEKAGSLTAILMDKTGTLTRGHQQVVDAVTVEHFDELAVQKKWPIDGSMNAWRYATSLIFALEKVSTHPVSQALVHHLSQPARLFEARNVQVISGFGTIGMVDGRRIMIGSLALFEREGISIPDAIRTSIGQWITQRYTSSLVAIDGVCVMAFCFSDRLRADAAHVVAYLKQKGVHPILITGDNQATAQAIASEVGIETVLSRVLPEQKEEKVRALKKEYAVVGMVGDGINDAPALAAADVGIAMGGGSDIAIESAGVVLLRSDIGLIPKVYELSLKTSRNIRQNLVWAFGYNILLVPVAMGVLYPWFGITMNPVLAGAAMAFSSLSVVINAARLSRTKL